MDTTMEYVSLISAYKCLYMYRPTCGCRWIAAIAPPDGRERRGWSNGLRNIYL